MGSNKLVKYDETLLTTVGNSIAITNKLIALNQPQLIPYRKKDKWGYCTPDKKIIIDCVYEQAGVFNSGVAIVKIDEKYRLIDNLGKYLSEQIFDEIDENSIKKLRAFKLKGKKGFINEKGDVVVQFACSRLRQTETESIFFASWKDGRAFISDSGNIIFDCSNYFFGLDYKGEEQDPFLSEGLLSYQNEQLCGFIDLSGKVVIPSIYWGAGDFREGLASVNSGGKWGFIDKNGEIKIALKFDQAGYFKHGISIVEINGKYGFIDKNGNEITALQYEGLNRFNRGLAGVKINGKWGFVDEAGNQVIECRYDDDSSWRFYVDDFGLIRINLNGKTGYIDKAGKTVIPFIYEDANRFCNQGLSFVKLNGKWGCINSLGETVISFEFDSSPHAFKNGIALIKINGEKCGYIDGKGTKYWED
jgi:hypothetical protein